MIDRKNWFWIQIVPHLFVAELFKLADFYGQDDLKLRCAKQLENLLTLETVCAVYSIAVQLDAKVTKHMIIWTGDLFASVHVSSWKIAIIGLKSCILI